MSSWLFRQAYFDFIDTPQTKDIPPVPDVEMYQLLDLALKSNSDLIYLTQKSAIRDFQNSPKFTILHLHIFL